MGGVHLLSLLFCLLFGNDGREMKDVLQSNKTEVHHFTLELAPQKWEVKEERKKTTLEGGVSSRQRGIACQLL